MMTSTSEGGDMFCIISVRAEDKLSLARGTFRRCSGGVRVEIACENWVLPRLRNTIP